jgi:hypothetical protein
LTYLAIYIFSRISSLDSKELGAVKDGVVAGWGWVQVRKTEAFGEVWPSGDGHELINSRAPIILDFSKLFGK